VIRRALASLRGQRPPGGAREGVPQARPLGQGPLVRLGTGPRGAQECSPRRHCRRPTGHFSVHDGPGWPVASWSAVAVPHGVPSRRPDDASGAPRSPGNHETTWIKSSSGSRRSGAVRRLNRGNHPPGVFQVGRHCVEKFCCRCTIDHAMVERQAEEHHRPLGDLPLIDYRLLDDPTNS
jgi:hypothetical protein